MNATRTVCPAHAERSSDGRVHVPLPEYVQRGEIATQFVEPEACSSTVAPSPVGAMSYQCQNRSRGFCPAAGTAKYGLARRLSQFPA